ncbi:MAG: polyphosphate kinase 2 family protein [Bradymonadaceae bacterium]|nr:polyphosphate kinase 2 family protein [Lujinxingiaceae bacterium]
MIDSSNYPSWLRVEPASFALSKTNTRDKRGADGHVLTRERAEAVHEENCEAIRHLQFLLYAENRRSVLVVLQAIDTGGKDGAIRHVFGSLNPQGVRVQSFKAPSTKERAHDFLWRVHHHAPERGHIQVFNRSHYEDVLVVRVKNYVPESVWRPRYQHINNFESLLADNDTLVVKFMLNISKDEQKSRLQARLDDRERNWKFDLGDLDDRKLWDEYQLAFNEAMIHTSTPHAPWYVIPADRKWFRNYAMSTILRQVLEAQDMQYPPVPEGLDAIVIDDL